MPILIRGTGGAQELKTALFQPNSATASLQAFSLGTTLNEKEIVRVRLFMYSAPDGTNDSIGGAHGTSLTNLVGSLHGSFPYEDEEQCKISAEFDESTGEYRITPGGSKKFIVYAGYALEVLYFD